MLARDRLEHGIDFNPRLFRRQRTLQSGIKLCPYKRPQVPIYMIVLNIVCDYIDDKCLGASLNRRPGVEARSA